MANLTIQCHHPDSVKHLIQTAIAKELKAIADGIRRTEERLHYFEEKYQMPTEEFRRRFESDELQHRTDMEFDEWIGDSIMLKGLQDDRDRLEGVRFVDY